MNNLEILRNEYPSISEESNGYWIVGAAINTVISHQNASEVFPPSGKEPMREFCGDDFALVYNTPFLKGNAEQHPSIFNMAENLLQEISTRTEGNIPLGTTSDGQWCAYMRNGISVGACGEILTCAYSIGTGNSFGNTRDGGLLKYAELVNQKVDAFYASDGHARCILRHPNYAKYIH